MPTFTRAGRITASAALLLLAAGCSGGGQPGHAFRVEEGEDGVPVGITSEVPRFAAPVVRFVEELRLVQDDARPESLLYYPSSVARSPDGEYVVVDRRDCRIVIYGPDGVFRRTFGRKGSGPGEFQLPVLQSVDERGIILCDLRTRHLVRYSLQGALLETRPIQVPGFMVRMMREGERYLYSRSETRVLPDGSTAQREVVTVTTAEGDTLSVIMSKDVILPPLELLPSGGYGVPVQYYNPNASVTYCAGRGLVEWHGVDTVLRLYDLEGRPVRRVRLDWTPDPVSADDRQNVKAHLLKEMEEASSQTSFEYTQNEMDNLSFADTKPFFDWVRLDDNGYIWLTPPATYAADDSQDDLRIKLLSPEGEYLGDAVLPRGRTLDIRGGLVFCHVPVEETGGLDVVVYRIESAVPGFVYP